MEENHIDNIFAYNLLDEVVFIDDVERGRKGYFCMGCKREMQAVKPKVERIRSYFRHDVKAMKDGKKCTYSDETYRHKLAKEILQINKKVKVPAIYKFPPKGYEGLPNLISNSKFIEAYSVGIERYFFEDDNGEISFGKNDESTSKYLLIKPDVTFFDKDHNPILLIELVATHKVTDDKKIRIKRLGIDAIQIIIPKDSPEAISKALQHTNNTKWIYNHEQEITEYIPISQSNSEGIQSIDEIQRDLFEESFKCRAAQIGNLLRTIKKCLGSELYTNIEREIRSEFSRVEKNTRGSKDQWSRICEDRRTEINSKYSEGIAEIETKRRRVEQEEISFQKNCRNLEGRYIAKKRELKKEERTLLDSELYLAGSEEEIRRIINDKELEIRGISEELDALETKGRNFDQARDELIRRFDSDKELAIREIDNEQAELESEANNFEQSKEKLTSGFEYDKRESNEIFEIDATGKSGEISRVDENIRDSPEKFRLEEAEIERRLEEDRRGRRCELDERNKRIIREIEEGKIGNYGRITSKVEDFNKSMALLGNISTIYLNRERIRHALETIRSGAYKNWSK